MVLEATDVNVIVMQSGHEERWELGHSLEELHQVGYMQDDALARVTEKAKPEDERKYRECCALETRKSVSDGKESKWCRELWSG